MGLEGKSLDSFITLLSLLVKDYPELLSSKTFRAYSLPTVDETSESLFARWPTSGIVSDGVCLTVATSESPNHVKESILLDVIETGEVPQRYFLSPNAAKGMMRRADTMGRTLFPPLRAALEILAQGQSSKELPTASTLAQQDTQELTGAEPMSLTQVDE
jgi:DNA (cytosine-5)-methyltransferase 1